MSTEATADLGGGLTVHWRFTDRSDGDFAITRASHEVNGRRRTIAPIPWTWLTQVHGAEVVTVERPGEHAGAEADGAVTQALGAPLSIQTADCGPVLLFGAPGVIGAAHVGWRGLVAGVLEATVAAMRDLGVSAVHAALGPMICPDCYEFGVDDLDRVVEAVGPDVRSSVDGGVTPALDLSAGLEAVLSRLEVDVVDRHDGCTAAHARSDEMFYSHRARGDAGRMTSVIWLTR